MPSLTFRPAEPRDRSVLTGFVVACARESEGASPDVEVVSRGLAEALASPGHRQYLVAEWDGEPVGCCLVTSEWSDWTARWYWWFQSVYVSAAWRGPERDVWRRMYAYVAGRAHAAGVEKLLLYVHKDNVRAQRAYAAVGMRPAEHLVFEAKV